jgi:hypothetical protein
MLQQVQGRIARARRSPAWWLRSRPTALRRAIGLLTFAIIGVLGIVALPRPDMAVYPMGRMVASLAALGVLLVLAIHQALRPLHAPAIGRAKGLVVIALALLATLVVTSLPPAHAAHPASIGGTGDELLSRAGACFYFGLLLGLPVYAIVRLLDRGSMLSAILAGAAAGLTGNFALQLHCPITATEHTVLAHFSVAAVFVAGVALLTRVEQRWKRSL